MLSPAEAYAIASQWGSYMNTGDPGAVFYGFHANDARPTSEAHRLGCIAYLCSIMATARPCSDWRDLEALRVFFHASELHPSGHKAPPCNELGLL